MGMALFFDMNYALLCIVRRGYRRACLYRLTMRVSIFKVGFSSSFIFEIRGNKVKRGGGTLPVAKGHLLFRY